MANNNHNKYIKIISRQKLSHFFQNFILKNSIFNCCHIIMLEKSMCLQMVDESD